MRVSLLVGTATLRQWVRNSGGDPAHAARYFRIALLVAPAVGVASGIWLTRALDGRWPLEFTPVAIVLLSSAISGAVMLLKATDLEASGAARGIAALPLGRGVRLLSVYLPLLGVLLVLSLAGTPPVYAIVADVAASTYAAVLAVVLLNAHGLLCGLALVGLARVVVEKARLTRRATYSVVALLWVASLAAGFARARRIGAGEEPGPAGWIADTVLGAPVISRLASEASLAAYGAALAAVVVAGVLAVRLTIVPAGARAGLLGEPHPPVRLLWSPRGRMPLARLHLRQLLRNGRIVGSAAASVALMALALVYVARVAGTDADLARSIFFPLAIATAHVCLTARGLSPRHRPYPLALGLGAARWAASVVVSAFAVAFLPWVAFVAATAAIVGDALTLLIGVGLGTFVLGAALTLGFLLVPGRENAGGEIAGLVLTTAAALGCVQVLHGLGVEGDAAVATSLVGAGIALCAVPLLVERARWRRDLGIA